MDIGFFINYGNEVIQLPVNPEKVTVNYKGNNSTTEIIQLGDINIIKDRKLAEISFSSFFPEYAWFPGIRTWGGFKKPQFYKDFILRIQADKRPCRLIITGLNITMKCSIESFEYYHQGGDHEDAYYSLSFKEYRDYAITEIAVDESLKRSTPTITYQTVQPPSPDKTTKSEPKDAPQTSPELPKTLSGTIAPATTVAPKEITVGSIVTCERLYTEHQLQQLIPWALPRTGTVELILADGTNVGAGLTYVIQYHIEARDLGGVNASKDSKAFFLGKQLRGFAKKKDISLAGG